MHVVQVKPGWVTVCQLGLNHNHHIDHVDQALTDNHTL